MAEEEKVSEEVEHVETALTPGASADDEGVAEPTPDDVTDNLPDFDFRIHIPKEFAEEACLKDIPDMGTFVKNYVHAQKRIGDLLSPPSPDATPEELTEFYQKMGAPEDIEGYKQAAAEKGIEVGGDFDRLAQVALKRGVSIDAMTDLLLEVNSMEEDSGVVNLKDAETALKVLRGEWGAAFDKNLGLAQKVVTTYGGTDLAVALGESGAGNNPAIIKAFATIGAALASDGIIDGAAAGVMTKQEALNKATELMASPAYLDGKDARHRGVVDEVARLFELAYPEADAQSKLVW